ncbi:protein draper-like isoform X2 [Ostrea edulis]|uniref:protein draper-like isoform X2 n=1 Tax=Ostrea edulis TaxID=37623 RepID=UPI0024AF8501|nr:protein draper-like isoform X2 [Ostrea edulis]
MRGCALLRVFVCSLCVMNTISLAWSDITDKLCRKRTSYTYINSYEGYISCPYYQQTCNGWFLSRRCQIYLKYTLCPRRMTRVDVAYRSLLVCCPGYVGLTNGTCLRDCTEGKYGNECQHDCNCPVHAYTGCDIDTGNCTCLPGWTGRSCNQVCPEGWFGSNCDSKCLCQNNATCRPIDGACNCTTPGWTGEFCHRDCPSTKYGQRCLENCTCSANQTCNPIDGSCTCIAGKMGTNCTEGCPVFRFGLDCSKTCSCVHSTGCDAVSGECFCEAGFSGKKCDEVCKAGTYGVNCNGTCNCTDAEVCDPETGECVSRCVCHEKGTVNCHTLYNSCKCLPNHNHICHAETVIQEERCRDVCECVSLDSTCCVSNSSRCRCRDGWTGPKCSKVCPRGTFGTLCNGVCNCSMNNQCHHVTGICSFVRISGKQKEHSPRAGYKYWIISAVLTLLLVAMAIALVTYLRCIRRVPKASKKPICPISKCCNCCKSNEKDYMERQRYMELQEDLDWTVNDDEYDHLNRSGQAKSELQIAYDPTYNRICENTSVYNLTTTPLNTNTVTADDDYSHIKVARGPEQHGMYDSLQNNRMKFPENTNKHMDKDSTLSQNTDHSVYDT